MQKSLCRHLKHRISTEEGNFLLNTPGIFGEKRAMCLVSDDKRGDRGFVLKLWRAEWSQVF